MNLNKNECIIMEKNQDVYNKILFELYNSKRKNYKIQ